MTERALELDGDLTLLTRWFDLRAKDIAVSPDSRHALVSTPKGVELIPLGAGTRRPLPLPFPLEVTSISWSRDGLAVTGGFTPEKTGVSIFRDIDADREVWRIGASEVLRHLDGGDVIATHWRAPVAAIQRWSRGAASPARSHEVRMGGEWQFDPDRMTREYWLADKAERPVAALLDGRVLTSHSETSADHTTNTGIFVWDLETGSHETLGTFTEDFGPGDAALPLPDSRRVLVWKWWGDHYLAMWDLREVREIWRHALDFASSAFAVDDAGSRMAFVLTNGRIQIRDTEDGRILVGARIEPHRYLGVESLAFTPDGRLLLGLQDGILALIDVP